MKFTDALVVLVFIFSLNVFAERGCKSIYELNEKANIYRRKVCADKFISESFRNTCNGKGFDSLNDWQSTCRSMWKLDYIGWADASDFMEVDFSNTEKKLMYGKWMNSFLENEVYCRSSK